MKPNLKLTLNDPLAEHAITVVLHLAPGESLNQRPLLVSLGVPDQIPVQAQGTFTDLERLIRTTWASFGMRMKANAAATPALHPETDDALEDEEGDEEFVAAAETDDTTIATAPLTPPVAPSAAPPAKRPVLEQPTLSLF